MEEMTTETEQELLKKCFLCTDQNGSGFGSCHLIGPLRYPDRTESDRNDQSGKSDHGAGNRNDFPGQYCD